MRTVRLLCICGFSEVFFFLVLCLIFGFRIVSGEASLLPPDLWPSQQHQHPPVCPVPAGWYDLVLIVFVTTTTITIITFVVGILILATILSSITTWTSCFSSEGWGRSVWGPNVQEFRRRFDTAKTKGEGTRRLKNLYFLYLLELRALSKVAPYFERAFVHLYTGNQQEDGATKELLLRFFSQIKWDQAQATTSLTLDLCNLWTCSISGSSQCTLMRSPCLLGTNWRQRR